MQTFEFLEKFRLRENAACDENLTEPTAFGRLCGEGSVDLVNRGHPPGYEEVAQAEAELAARDLIGKGFEDLARGHDSQPHEDLAHALAELTLALNLERVVEHGGRDECLVDE